MARLLEIRRIGERLVALPPYPEKVLFAVEAWTEYGGKFEAPDGEPLCYVYDSLAEVQGQTVVVAVREQAAPDAY